MPTTAEPQRVAFEFHNTGTNLQLLLPMTVTIGCGDSAYLAPAPPTHRRPQASGMSTAIVEGDVTKLSGLLQRYKDANMCDARCDGG